MKKIVRLFLVCNLAMLMLAGCGLFSYNTFPKEYTFGSVNVGGMTEEEAKKALEEAASNYTLTLDLDGREVVLTGEMLGLTYNSELDFADIITKANKEQELDEASVFVVGDESSISDLIRELHIAALTEAISFRMEDVTEDAGPSADEIKLALASATNRPRIAYSKDAKAFIGVNGVACEMYDYEDAKLAVLDAVAFLLPQASASPVQITAEGIPAEGDAEVEAALVSANEYLALNIQVNFSLEGYKPSTTTFEAKDIAKWLEVEDNGLDVLVSEEALSTYITDVARSHDKSVYKTAKFQTTASGEIDIRMPVTGKSVDENALYEAVLDGLTNKTDVNIDAVFVEIDPGTYSDVADFGGNYCEVDMSNQKVYVYKNGELVVECSVVTGCVANGCATPTGVYSIFAKNKDRYLRGPGYESWVNFFCPFNGGIGFHDATWRKNFGNNIYVYNGSHGCINMPYKYAKALYENVEVGTKVICYGGLKSVPKNPQNWYGQTFYALSGPGTTFQIYNYCEEAPTYSYKSSNPNVATVDANGVITATGNGTCVITISSSETPNFGASSLEVTVQVGY